MLILKSLSNLFDDLFSTIADYSKNIQQVVEECMYNGTRNIVFCRPNIFYRTGLSSTAIDLYMYTVYMLLNLNALRVIKAYFCNMWQAVPPILPGVQAFLYDLYLIVYDIILERNAYVLHAYNYRLYMYVYAVGQSDFSLRFRQMEWKNLSGLRNLNLTFREEKCIYMYV
jgi:hypothetical protein